MSQLDKLINELCPDGVEYKTLDEIFDIRNGYTPSKSKAEYWENGIVPWFRMDDIRENGRILSSALQKVTMQAVKNKPFSADSIIVSTSATIGEHALINVDFMCNQRFTCLTLKKEYQHQFSIKFLFYYCFKLDKYCMNNLKKGSFASVDMTKFNQFQIPVPPLEVQREIVRILDEYSEKVTALKHELEKELELRKKQYSYYRDKLLTFGDDVEWKSLEETCIIKRGDYITKKEVKNGNIPVILGGQEPAYYCDRFNHNGEVVVVSRSGASAGFVSYWNQPIFVTDGFAYKGKEYLCTRYLYFILKNMQSRLNKMKCGGGIPHIQGKTLEKIKIPVPPIEEQKRIVNILDRFDALCNDLTSGIPAEITARQKQYEYYRNKLLQFKSR
ncbi:MAG: restriction endonuclease subunit S [Prevotella sp.]|nr:restriction endonuclease subunit S [Alistipes senegalensis]MCM1356982.1 restriction endonuclease subunit S [Prevotella sp.]MCM1474006.1 restriction endonuclease subunit S [Muribaculaceae bacterium]